MNEYLMAFVVISCIMLDVCFAIMLYKASKLTGDDEPVKQKEFRQWREHIDNGMTRYGNDTHEKIIALSSALGYRFIPQMDTMRHIPAHYEKVSKKK